MVFALVGDSTITSEPPGADDSSAPSSDTGSSGAGAAAFLVRVRFGCSAVSCVTGFFLPATDQPFVKRQGGGMSTILPWSAQVVRSPQPLWRAPCDPSQLSRPP